MSPGDVRDEEASPCSGVNDMDVGAGWTICVVPPLSVGCSGVRTRVADGFYGWTLKPEWQLGWHLEER